MTLGAARAILAAAAREGTGAIDAILRTWTTSWFTGFHGGVYLILSDSEDLAVAAGRTPMQRFGVDGTAIGQHDRTDAWTASIATPDAQRVEFLHVFQTWAPDSFQSALTDAVGKAVLAGAKKVGELAPDVATIAKMFIGRAMT